MGNASDVASPVLVVVGPIASVEELASSHSRRDRYGTAWAMARLRRHPEEYAYAMRHLADAESKG